MVDTETTADQGHKERNVILISAAKSKKHGRHLKTQFEAGKCMQHVFDAKYTCLQDTPNL